jgi:hypothetical protein
VGRSVRVVLALRASWSTRYAAVNMFTGVGYNHMTQPDAGHPLSSRALQSTVHVLCVADYSLKRLREHSADPLFIRRGTRLLTTKFCDRLMPEVRELLLRLDRCSTRTKPSTRPAHDGLSIAHERHRGTVLLPRMLDVFATQAPHAGLDVVQSKSEDIGDLLACPHATRPC